MFPERYALNVYYLEEIKSKTCRYNGTICLQDQGMNILRY
jgi:hypothetical protein